MEGPPQKGERAVWVVTLSSIICFLVPGKELSESGKMSQAWCSVGNTRSPDSMCYDIPERERELGNFFV